MARTTRTAKAAWGTELEMAHAAAHGKATRLTEEIAELLMARVFAKGQTWGQVGDVNAIVADLERIKAALTGTAK